MSPMAAILSEQDMADLATYFSSQAVRGGETDPSKAKLGQRVYRSGNVEGKVMACAGCHGPPAAATRRPPSRRSRGSMRPTSPCSSGPTRPGTRTTDPNQMMRNMAALLSDEEIDAVASYVQGLR